MQMNIQTDQYRLIISEIYLFDWLKSVGNLNVSHLMGALFHSSRMRKKNIYAKLKWSKQITIN